MRRTLLYSLIPACAAALLALWASDPFVGFTVDSGTYLSTADGLIHGHGLTMPYVSYNEAFRVLGEAERVPITEFPPLYPLLVAAFDSLGFSLLGAARAINLVCYLASVWIVTAFVWRRTGSVFPTILAAALILGPHLLVIHAMAWSEAPAIVAMLGCLSFTARYHDHGQRHDLVWAGLCAALSTMARIAGVAFIVGVGVTLLLKNRDDIQTRVRRAAAFVGLSSIPVAAWFVRNAVVVGVPSEKSPSWHPPSPSDLGRVVESVGAWVVPGPKLAMVTGFLLLALALGGALRRRHRSEPTPLDPIVRICLVIGASYFAFLLLVLTFLDLNLSLDTRMLSPLQVLAIVALCCGVGSMKVRVRWVEVVLVIIAAVSAIRSVELAKNFDTSPYVAYTGTAWRNSETLAYAGTLPDDTVVITNAPDAIWLWHRTSPQLIPPMSNLFTGKENDAFLEQLREVADATSCRRGVVVFFDRPTRKTVRTINPLAIAELGLTKTERFTDGEVYEVDEPPCPQETSG